MHKYTLALLSIILGAIICPGYAAGAELGSNLERSQLRDLSGETRTLNSYSGKTIVLVFWSFKCPVSLEYNDRIEKLQKKYFEKGIIVIGVAPTGISADEIRMNAANLKIQYPIMMDFDGILAEKLGATHTPEVFILDAGSVLRYRGALDNNKRTGESGRIAYVDDAIDAIIAGRNIATPETRSFGCSIKRLTR
jgi:thiol-disulfide isomerase/thioredoxin